jgi:hypothetical protein
MPGPLTASPAPSPLAAADLARVRVQLAGKGGSLADLGSAADALRDARLTDAERDAIEALVRAVELLRTRGGMVGIDDAQRGVRLVLRDSDAGSRGPWATAGRVSVGAKNALASRAGDRARTDVLLTVDAAVHELTHVVQFAKIPSSATPHAAILEGIADTVAMLATNDDTLGEGYYKRDASGRYRGAIRELGDHVVSGPTLGGVIRRYQDAIAPGAEEHAAGGVVSATFSQVRARLGRERAEQLVWAVIRDTPAWKSGGSWRELALAIRRDAAAIWSTDPAALAAVDAALAATGLDAAAA